MSAISNEELIKSRDEALSYNDKYHAYTVGDTSYVSCTTFLHKFFQPFDPDKIIGLMKRGKDWKKSEYYGLSSTEIKDMWTNAANKGTKLHLCIETYLNFIQANPSSCEETRALAVSAAEHTFDDGSETAICNSPEWSYFLKFWKDADIDYEPYRTEWKIWSNKDDGVTATTSDFSQFCNIAGGIDCILRRKKDGKFFIFDWKRSKSIRKFNNFQRALPPIQHLDDCNYIHYSLQLNLYKTLIEKNYGIKIEGMFLVILHPSNPGYVLEPVQEMPEEIKAVLKYNPEEQSAAEHPEHSDEESNEGPPLFLQNVATSQVKPGKSSVNHSSRSRPMFLSGN